LGQVLPLRLRWHLTIESWKRIAVYKDAMGAEHRLDGMRKAGLPEG
jgi:hypothetical protein